jgi:uncharacterized membrane protein
MVSWARHVRFLTAFGLGLAVMAATQGGGLDLAMRALMAVNVFFVTYLALMAWMTLTTSSEDLRRHSEQDDEGMALILALAVVAVGVALTSVFLVLNRSTDSAAETAFALAAAPMGWAMLHVLAAYRYAHLYYAPDPDAGLNFPATTAPGTWDFLYFAFTVGMTAQVSDVVVTTAQMRRVVLFHSVGSFFYNTVILALVVNAGLTLSR